MSNELRLSHATPSLTSIYAVIRDEATLKVWNGTGLVTWVDANIATYAITLTDQSGDLYTADAPANLAAGTYKVFYYNRAGGSPAITDTLLASTELVWNPLGTSTVSSSGQQSPTRLEAVNEILSSINQAPIVSLDTGGTSDAAEAEVSLDTANRKIQNKGWHCNTEHNVTLVPDGEGKIPLGNDVMVVDADPNRSSSTLDVCRRGKNLYDLKNKTDLFTVNVVVKLTRLLAFEDLGPVLKDYVVARAKIEFQRTRFGSIKNDSYLRDDLERAEINAEQEENEVGDHNILDNPTAREIIGIGPGVLSHF